MSNFRLNSGDILVNINDRHDPFSRLKRWAMTSPFEHVSLYMGELGLFSTRAQRRIIRVPMLFESNGRGVVIQSLSNRYGQQVMVMRLISEHDRRRIPRVLIEAIALASSPQSYYDYLGIVRWVLPRIICEKLGLPMPLKYQRNPAMICSEACAEVFWRAGLADIVPKGEMPLPSSFVASSLLARVWKGKLSCELV